jgi:hypothetical protein
MAYKGEDLDLRGPQSTSGWAQSGQDGDGGLRGRGRQAPTQKPAALYVDEVLLDCANHAYDLASGNGAREVMLEHLILAMTRVPRAAQIMEDRGVNVVALRSECATVVANDIPVSTGQAGQTVRASSDYDAVLHLAAANARLRSDKPTSVRDVLFVLINYDRETRGIELLRRHWPNWRQDDLADRLEPVRPQPRPNPIPREVTPLVDRGDRDQLMHAFEARLDLVEKGFGNLTNDLGRERRMLSDVVASLQDTVASVRSDGQSFRNMLGERLQRFEKALDQVRYDGGAGGGNIEAILTSRLQRLEKMQESLLAQRSSVPALEATLNDRFMRLEKALEANRADGSRLPSGMSDRLGVLERTVENRLAELSRTWNALGDRMQRLERSLEGVTSAMPAGLLDRMHAMEKAFEAKINEGMRSWGSVGERLIALERSLSAQRAEVAHIQAAVTSELKAIEKAVGTQQIGGPAVGSFLDERFETIDKSLEQHRQEMATFLNRLPGAVGERLQVFERALGSVREDTGRLAQLQEGELAEVRAAMTRLAGSQQTLSAAIDQWRLDNTGDLGILSNRLEALEHSSVRPIEMLENLGNRIGSASAPQAQPAGHGSQFPPQARVGSRMTRIPTNRGFWRWLFGLS